MLITLDEYEDNANFAENVRNISEVFYFVNQRTWSRDGHKCLTLEVSEDPGRPCVFPFTWNNVTYEKCAVPST